MKLLSNSKIKFASAPICAVLLLAGCARQQPTYNMAPPIAQQQTAPVSTAPPMENQGGGGQQASGVYQWQDVPQGQQVPITHASFDQGGYQIIAQSGETIVVPFVNQSLYVLKFGRTSGQPYFINEGQTPVLYLQPGGYLENAAAQNARWYPIPNDYAYSQPMYVAVAPTWGEYLAMGWYPGMSCYGGMWGYSPYSHFGWMPGYYVGIGGVRYTSFVSYHSYYTVHRNYYRTTTVYHNYSAPRGGTFGSARRSFGSSNVGARRTFGGSAAGSTGSFRSGGTRTFGGGGSFGTRPSGGGSFGTRPAGGSSFGGGRSAGSGSSFGGGRAAGGSSFGGGRSSGGSFGGGGRSFGGGRRR